MSQIPPRKMKALLKRDARPQTKKDAPPVEDDDEDTDEADDPAEDSLADIVAECGDRVEAGDQDPVLHHLMADFDPAHNPPAWVENEAIWERAKKAVDPEGKGAEKWNDVWGVVAAVYSRMGGSVKRGGSTKE